VQSGLPSEIRIKQRSSEAGKILGSITNEGKKILLLVDTDRSLQKHFGAHREAEISSTR